MTRGPILLVLTLSLATWTACRREDRDRGRAAAATQLPPLVAHSPMGPLAVAGLRAEKTETRIVHGVGEGHGYRKQVKEELRRSFDWVVDGDPTWRMP